MELGYLKYYLKKEYYKKINEKIVKYKDSYESSIERQEKWRQKQINIFYRTGRPIFEEDYKKMLIRNNI
tara:strand:+ start:191 stop:397 length:207 start_codon:yes stop_codon:yes gene_type:complete